MLSNFVKDDEINRTMVVENALIVGSKNRHVFFPVGDNVSIWHFHGHLD